MHMQATAASLLRRAPAIRRFPHTSLSVLRSFSVPKSPALLSSSPNFSSRTIVTSPLNVNKLIWTPASRPHLNRTTTPFPYLHLSVSSVRNFHSSRPNSGVPYILVALLKTSTSLGWTQTIGRIAMTMFPIAIAKRWFIRRYTRMFPLEKYPHMAQMYAKMARGMKWLRLTTWFIFLIPGVLFFVTILASMERTPLTGRWRVILLSPEEEEGIAQQLAGVGWYNAVAEILGATSPQGLPKVIPADDWRTQWVLDTLRRLESAIPYLQDEQRLHSTAFAGMPPGIPVPPPSEFPLMARPRATQSWHMYVEGVGDPAQSMEHVPPHAILGPPYSLLLVERSDASNAFSYGFGPEGGGGIVVYSGFLDEILRKSDAILAAEPIPAPSTPTIWSLFTGSGGRGSISTRQQQSYSPTPQQTDQLAILLAHELAHLILSHHLETLSSATIFLPSLMSILSDVLRTVLFPVTMLLGPFVQDGIAELGRMGLGEVTKAGESCSSRKMELEADIVSVRLLAYAGFDARSALKFWEGRVNSCEEASNPNAAASNPAPSGRHSFWPMRKSDNDPSHPIGEIRVKKLKKELARWDEEAMRRQQEEPPGK